VSMKLWSYRMSDLDLNRWVTTPIPELPGVEGRKDVQIVDCGEPLVPLSGFAPDLIIVRPQYALCGYLHAISEAFAREKVAKTLRDAAQLLRPSYRLLIWDAWRPKALQEELFLEYREKLRRAHPEYSEERLARETEIYVSLPSRDASVPAPHSTGGAVDLTICDPNGQSVPMGTDFDHFGPEAATRFFEERILSGEELSEQERLTLGYRRLLFWVLTMQGFTSYREEWWHFDFGDQFWGRITGRPSIYAERDNAL